MIKQNQTNKNRIKQTNKIKRAKGKVQKPHTDAETHTIVH